MKYIIGIILILNSLASFADEYYKGTVVYLDGKTRVGLLEGTLGEAVLFKASEKAEAEKIQSSSLISVSLQVKDELREFFYLKVFLGWGQKRLSNDPMWLRVVEKGTATLVVNKTSMRGSIYTTTKANFSDYYAYRKGEPGAKLICQVSTLNNNQTFRAKAPIYFADYPELAAKIKSKEYTWKELQVVFKEYNNWVDKTK